MAEEKGNVKDSVASSLIPEDGTVYTSDEMIEKIAKNRTWKFDAYVIWLILIWIRAPTIVYITSFAGLDPDTTYLETWTCLTEPCERLVNAWNVSELHKIPCATRKTADGKVESLLQPSDFKWNLTRTSFSVDFNLINCGEGSEKGAKTLLSSIYFAGALTALLTGTFIFDNIGRKRSALIGCMIELPITLCGTFCHDYYFLLAIRFIQGFGEFMVSTPMFILVQEILPARLRNYSNSLFQMCWALGYAVATAVGYFVHDWNYMFLTATCIMLVLDIPVFLCKETPRFYLMKNNTDAAKDSLKFLASLNNEKLDLDNIVIADIDKTKERKQSYFQQIKDMFNYPMLFIETILQMFLWFTVAMSYYGFNFGWGSIFPDLYIGYLMGMVGEIIAYIALTPLIASLGRRRSIMLMFLGAGIAYLVAIPDVNLDESGSWTLESLACLVGVIFVSSAFSGVYLWSGELSPTSHRGLVYGVSSSAGRVGSFLGPFIILNLRHLIGKTAPLVGLSALMFMCLVSSFLLVETGDKDIALTGEDIVKRRREEYQYRI